MTSGSARQPLLSLADAPRERLVALLRDLGLVGAGGTATATDTMDGTEATADADDEAAA